MDGNGRQMTRAERKISLPPEIDLGGKANPILPREEAIAMISMRKSDLPLV
jgi:hypothetical protein